jgi:hypothetical protein
VLVDELDVPVPTQQQTKIVERADHSLQLHSIDQEDRHRHLVLADVIEEHVLEVLLFLGWHPPISFSARLAACQGSRNAAPDRSRTRRTTDPTDVHPSMVMAPSQITNGAQASKRHFPHAAEPVA